MIAYKCGKMDVVGGTVHSVVIHSREYGCVAYSEGQTTIPQDECGPLMCFDTLEKAQNFVNPKSELHVIFECEVVESKYKEAWLPNEKCNANFPGTIYCDSVTPIRRM